MPTSTQNRTSARRSRRRYEAMSYLNQKPRRGSKAEPSRVPARGLTEVVRHRAAISEVLRVIASSPHDLQPIFDTIIGNAVRLCRANVGVLRLSEGKALRLAAH